MTEEFRHRVLNERTLDGKFRAGPQRPLPVLEILETIKVQYSLNHEGLHSFQRLFFCYRTPSSSDHLALKLIAEAVRLSLLSAEAEFINVVPDLRNPPETRGPIHGRTTESSEHQAMKFWVQQFLSLKGIKAAMEVSQLGYLTDVASLSNGVFIECGDTEPSKVLSFLRNGKSIGILQYDAEEIVWFRPLDRFPAWVQEQALDLLA